LSSFWRTLVPWRCHLTSSTLPLNKDPFTVKYRLPLLSSNHETVADKLSTRDPLATCIAYSLDYYSCRQIQTFTATGQQQVSIIKPVRTGRHAKTGKCQDKKRDIVCQFTPKWIGNFSFFASPFFQPLSSADCFGASRCCCV
jgi:hypothetical protein